MLAEKIHNGQGGNEACMLEIIKSFNGLLWKYAYRLNYDDAINDMTVEFIALLRRMDLSIFPQNADGAVVNYIVQSMRHAYIKLSKRSALLCASEVSIGDLSETQQYYISGLVAPQEDELNNFKMLLLYGSLTKNEEDVIVKKFFFALSSAEIAQEIGISRQSVNQTKNRALRKLRLSIDS